MSNDIFGRHSISSAFKRRTTTRLDVLVVSMFKTFPLISRTGEFPLLYAFRRAIAHRLERRAELGNYHCFVQYGPSQTRHTPSSLVRICLFTKKGGNFLSDRMASFPELSSIYDITDRRFADCEEQHEVLHGNLVMLVSKISNLRISKSRESKPSGDDLRSNCRSILFRTWFNAFVRDR
jgi:hypothetical protein